MGLTFKFWQLIDVYNFRIFFFYSINYKLIILYFWESGFAKSAYKLRLIEYFESHIVTPVDAKNEPLVRPLEFIEKVHHSGTGGRRLKEK